jgi:hypothetical protein
MNLLFGGPDHFISDCLNFHLDLNFEVKLALLGTTSFEHFQILTFTEEVA